MSTFARLARDTDSIPMIDSGRMITVITIQPVYIVGTEHYCRLLRTMNCRPARETISHACLPDHPTLRPIHINPSSGGGRTTNRYLGSNNDYINNAARGCKRKKHRFVRQKQRYSETGSAMLQKFLATAALWSDAK